MTEHDMGDNLRHLADNIGMGECYGWYEKADDQCKKCMVKSRCKVHTEKKQDELATGNNHLALVDAMNKIGFECTREQENEQAKMIVFLRDSTVVRVILSYTTHRVLVQVGDFKHTFDTFDAPRIVGYVEGMC